MSQRLERLPARIDGAPLTLSAWLRFDHIARAVRETTPAAVIEIGTGGGAMATRLCGARSYAGVEMDDDSRSLASTRLSSLGVGPVVKDVDELEPGLEPADLLCSFEVLEHIDDDLGALRSWTGLLSGRGHVLVSVPAHPEDFNEIDAHVGHLRRYSRADIAALHDGAGLDILWCANAAAGIGPVLHRLQAALVSQRESDASASVEDRTSASGRFMQPSGPVMGVILWATSLPLRLFQRVVPSARGSSFVVLSRRRS